MIAHFALMGDLYQYDPYNTEASLWNSYSWQIGADSSLDFKATVPAFTMTKTIWGIDDSDSSIGASSAELGAFSMYATLIIMDNFGNLGSGLGAKPAWLVRECISTTSGGVVSVFSELKVIHENANSERADEPVKLISTLSGTVLIISSNLIIIHKDSNSERLDDPDKTISILSGTVVGVTSEVSQ